MLATMNGRKHQGISKTHALWQHWNRTGPGTNTRVYKWAPFHTVYNVYLLTEAPWLLVVQMIWTHGFYWRPCLACIGDLASIRTYRLDPYLLSNVNHVTMLNYAAWLSDYWSQEEPVSAHAGRCHLQSTNRHSAVCYTSRTWYSDRSFTVQGIWAWNSVAAESCDPEISLCIGLPACTGFY